MIQLVVFTRSRGWVVGSLGIGVTIDAMCSAHCAMGNSHHRVARIRSCVGSSNRKRMILAGFPPTMAKSETSLVTTAPAQRPQSTVFSIVWLLSVVSYALIRFRAS